MDKIKSISVIGARPNFVKVAPIIKEMNKYNDIKHLLIHTGQHYNYEMSKIFFNDLDIPNPDFFLGVGSGSHAEQTATIMIEFEKVLVEEKPDLIIVVGDVNSTLACSIVASKMLIPVAHVEAGLRSFDRTMPEEINRIVTDSLSDFLFTTCHDANKNLEREGIPKEKIHFVGNVMIDTLKNFLNKSENSKIRKKLKLLNENYIILTLHRPSNVDNKSVFVSIIKALKDIQKKIKIVFPAHPRTIKMINFFKLNNEFKKMKNFIFIEPLSYLDFLHLVKRSKFVMTDSGGIQEETTVLNIPCLTLRRNTERPITITEGSNILVGNNYKKIIEESFKILNGQVKKAKIPELWDGKAAERIVTILRNNLT